MASHTSWRLLVVLGLCYSFLILCFNGTTVEAASPVNGPSTFSGKRWVTFDLTGSDGSGDIQTGKPLELSIAIGGVAQGHAPMVAICESVLFERQMVTLEPDQESMVMRATAALEPIPAGKLSIRPKVARVQVTFARAQKDKFERVMTRIVYVTLGDQNAV